MVDRQRESTSPTLVVEFQRESVWPPGEPRYVHMRRSQWIGGCAWVMVVTARVV